MENSEIQYILGQVQQRIFGMENTYANPYGSLASVVWTNIQLVKNDWEEDSMRAQSF